VRRSNEELVEIPGQDSFLDVITNIVGILILLVLIVGIRTSRSVVSAARAEAAREDETVADAKQAERAYQNAVDNLNGQVARAMDIRNAVLLREQERDLMATMVAAGEREINERRATLSQQQQRDFDLRRQLNEAQKQLDDLGREQVSLLAQGAEVEVVKNLPTPLAKTVTGEEIHLRLAGGHVAIVPMEKLHEAGKPHLERNVWRLRDEGEMEGTVGPIDGFRMRYLVQLSQVSVPGRAGFVEVHPVIHERYEYIPVSQQLGEPIDQVIQPNSTLLQLLRRRSPADTTVTIWIYPDSFDEFRTLKKALFDLGYAAAGRPKSEGEQIASSSEGTKSSAQ
jgi:hypothetical protein